MAGQDNLDAHFGGALHYRIEVLHLEPEEHTITVRFVGAISDGAVVVLGFKAVQLQYELAILYQLLVLPATMSSAAVKQALIPLAAGFDIRDTDERLGTHSSERSRTCGLDTRVQGKFRNCKLAQTGGNQGNAAMVTTSAMNDGVMDTTEVITMRAGVADGSFGSRPD